MEEPLYFSFSLHGEITDLQELYAAAFLRAQEDGLTEDEAREALVDNEEPHGFSVRDCLIFLLDPGSMPGAEIRDSSVEEY